MKQFDNFNRYHIANMYINIILILFLSTSTKTADNIPGRYNRPEICILYFLY
jgi:hypothetical protein